MTDKELAEIIDREKAAIPGPWEWDGADYIESLVSQYKTPKGYPPANVIICDIGNAIPVHKGNAHFIAHARSDIPMLVAEVKHLRDMLRGISPNKYQSLGRYS